jgi:hypothetical protein
MDYASTNGGRYPTDHQLRDFGHDIVALLQRCERISTLYRNGKEHAIRPNSPIHQGIVVGLSEFGILSRYYNLDLIGGGKASTLPEPIGAWWTRVAAPILAKHYSEAQRRKDEERATTWAGWTSPLFVQHYTEDEERIDDPHVLWQWGAARIIETPG